MGQTLELYGTVAAKAPEWSRARRLLGHILVVLARYSEAEPHLRAALQRAHDDRERALVSNSLALLYYYTAKWQQAEPLYRRSLAIAEQAYGPEHPTVAAGLNNLAQLLQATNRLAAAEPLFHRMAAIFHRFDQHTGHEHPSMQAGLENYRRLLNALEVPPKEIERRVQAAMQTSGPLEPLTPEVERWLGPVQPVQAVLAALDAQYQQDNKPAVWFLPPDQPIAPHLDELLGPSVLNVPLDQPIGSHLENLLGPARSTQEVLDALDRQYREQGKSPVWFLAPDEPLAPHLDELLGPVAEGNAEKG
jgi:tetratricopeptide (TPR) repeat protein